jgi:hypothetical protein
VRPITLAPQKSELDQYIDRILRQVRDLDRYIDKQTEATRNKVSTKLKSPRAGTRSKVAVKQKLNSSDLLKRLPLNYQGLKKSERKLISRAGAQRMHRHGKVAPTIANDHRATTSLISQIAILKSVILEYNHNSTAWLKLSDDDRQKLESLGEHLQSIADRIQWGANDRRVLVHTLNWHEHKPEIPKNIMSIAAVYDAALERSRQSLTSEATS